MKSVEIYTTPFCPYCHAAKRLLEKKGVAFVETDVSRDPALRQAMMKRANGRHTVPQIFIGGQHVGGSDDIHLLDHQGRLDPLLAD
jgi:glutaredoxin 3